MKACILCYLLSCKIWLQRVCLSCTSNKMDHLCCPVLFTFQSGIMLLISIDTTTQGVVWIKLWSGEMQYLYRTRRVLAIICSLKSDCQGEREKSDLATLTIFNSVIILPQMGWLLHKAQQLLPWGLISVLSNNRSALLLLFLVSPHQPSRSHSWTIARSE